jgi:hypothetical protein
MIRFGFFLPVSNFSSAPPLIKFCISLFNAVELLFIEETGKCFLLQETAVNKIISQSKAENLESPFNGLKVFLEIESIVRI